MPKNIEIWSKRPSRDRRVIELRDVTEHTTTQFEPVQWMNDFAQVINATGGAVRNIDEKGFAFIKALYRVNEALDEHSLPIPTEWKKSPQVLAAYSNMLGRNLGYYDRFRPIEDLRKHPLSGDELALELAFKIGRSNIEAAKNTLRGFCSSRHTFESGRNSEFFNSVPDEHERFRQAKSELLISQLEKRLEAEEARKQG